MGKKLGKNAKKEKFYKIQRIFEKMIDKFSRKSMFPFEEFQKLKVHTIYPLIYKPTLCVYVSVLLNKFLFLLSPPTILNGFK